MMERNDLNKRFRKRGKNATVVNDGVPFIAVKNDDHLW
jgi:hypothetical protein